MDIFVAVETVFEQCNDGAGNGGILKLTQEELDEMYSESGVDNDWVNRENLSFDPDSKIVPFTSIEWPIVIHGMFVIYSE